MPRGDGARPRARTTTPSSSAADAQAPASAAGSDAALAPKPAAISSALPASRRVSVSESAPPSAKRSIAETAPGAAPGSLPGSAPGSLPGSVSDTVSASEPKGVAASKPDVVSRSEPKAVPAALPKPAAPPPPPKAKAVTGRSLSEASRQKSSDESTARAAASKEQNIEQGLPALRRTASDTSASSATATGAAEKATLADKTRSLFSAFQRRVANTSASSAGAGAASAPPAAAAAAPGPAKGILDRAKPWVSAIRQKVSSQPYGTAATALLLLGGVALATRSTTSRQNPIENIDFEYDPDIEFDPEVSTKDDDYDSGNATTPRIPYPTGGYSEGPYGVYKGPCKTKMCELMKRVYAQVGTSGAEPCDDFFGYVCGTLSRDDQEEFGVDDIPDIAGRYVDNYMRDSFEKYIASKRNPTTAEKKEYSEKHSDSERQIAAFFVSCLERNSTAEKKFNTQTLIDLFVELGIPLVNSSTNTVFSALVKLSTLYGVMTPLLKFDIVWSTDRTDKLVSLSTMETPKRVFRHSPILMQAKPEPFVHYNPFEYNKDSITPVRRKFLEIYTIRAKNARYRHPSNEDVRYVTALASGLGLPWDKAAAPFVGLHYGVIKEFINWVTEEVKKSASTERYFLGDLGQLEEKTSTDWVKLLNHNVKTYFKITNQTKVLAKNLRWVSIMSEMLLDSRFAPVFKHYVQVFILGELAVYADLELEQKLCAIQPTTCHTAFPDEVAFCRTALKDFFPKSYLAKIGREMVHPHELLKSRAVNSFVLLNFVDLLSSGLSWMDKDTKQRVAVKIASMFTYVGFPDELKQDRAVEHKIRVRELFLENVLLVMNARALRKLVLFNGFYERTTRLWPDHLFPAHRVSYDPRDNSMVIPASILTFPFYLESAPFWVNVLTLGYNIAHHLFHALEDKGVFDNMGRQLKSSSWSDSSIDKFKEKAECFRRQIEKDEINSLAKLNFSDGFDRVDEAMADNGAFVLMITLLDHLQWQNLTQILPGINARFSMSQLRFLAPTLQFCFPGYRYRLGNDLVYSQPFDEWRFNEAVSNIRELPRSFQCHEEDRLARKPTDRCEIWIDSV